MAKVLSGGGNHDGLVNGFSAGSFKTHRGKDAKRHSLLRLIEFGLFMNIVDKLSLNFRNILISPLEGEKKFLSELGELSNKGRLGILEVHP